MGVVRAIIFDFNGVLVDDEPIHYHAFRDVLDEQDIRLSEEEYRREYLAMDDRSCFTAVLRTHGRAPDPETIAALIARKAERYHAVVKRTLPVFPGVADVIRAAAPRYALAIASGALRREIEYILDRTRLLSAFEVIIAAEDVTRGKPDPEAYRSALHHLNHRSPRANLWIDPPQCLVVEDAPAGIVSARAAGMHTVGVAHSYPAEMLAEADIVIPRLEGYDFARAESILAERGAG